LITGRTLRLGLLACGPVTSSGLQEVGKVYPNMLRGVLKEWGVWESNPTWKSVRQDECTEATWVADDHNVVVETLGESLLADTGYPDLEEIKSRGFDGLVTVGIVDDDWIDGLLALGIPTVLADYSGEKFTRRADQVFFDPEFGYREAVRYFAQQGLSRIFFLGATLYLPASPGPRPPRRGSRVEALANAPRRVDPDSYLRLSAYRREMETIGLHPKEEWIAFQSQQEELLLPLAQRWAGLPGAERPQAVVCHGFAQAEFLERHFAGHGHALRVAGASVTQALRGACPIVADGEELGAAAGALLVSRLQRASRPTLRVGVTMTFHPTAIQ
jgi:DNA-binding LacI/PurR family transcriptional regulator